MKNLTDWSQKDLLILAFDHRASFIEKLFGIKGRAPTADEKKKIEEAKQIIFEGFKAATKKKVPKEIAGLLVDEEFGAAILREAKKDGFNFAMPAEKSGQDEFDFEYGDQFGKHIEDFDPTYLKVLVRYNPESDAALNKRQIERLKKLSDYLAKNKRPFLFELIVPATPAQLAKLGGSKEKYDLELRPKLMCEAIKANPRRRRRRLHLETRRRRRPQKRQSHRQTGTGRRTQSRRHHLRTWRIQRQSQRMARSRRKNPRYHRLRSRPNHILGSTRRVQSG